MSSIDDRVFKVFAEIFKLPEGVDKDKLIYNEYPGWDSVAHMNLVAGLETEFDCMLEMEHILDMSSFQKCVEIIGGYVE